MQYVQRVSRIGQVVRKRGFELLTVLLLGAALLQLVAERESDLAPRMSLWLAIPAIAVLVLPLVARRRFPFVALTAWWLLAAGLSFVDGRLMSFTQGVFVLGMVVSFLLGNLRDAVHARIGAAVVIGGAAVVVYNAPDESPSAQIFIPILFGTCWLAGFVLRERAEQAEAAEVRAVLAEREQESAARIAVAEERARIARELHDVVAHAVSVMVLQVGAVRHNLPDSLDDDAGALEDVERTGRTALTEMRRLLGAMRRDGDGLELGPQPSLASLDSLVAGVERAGLPVRLHIEGERVPLPRAIDLSAYRIVQEGLTNALKHANAKHADVTVRYRPDEVQIEVRDDGRGGGASDGNGHGLVGIKERVKIYGGEMSVGTAAEGGFVLTTRLPLGGDRP